MRFPKAIVKSVEDANRRLLLDDDGRQFNVSMDEVTKTYPNSSGAVATTNAVVNAALAWKKANG